MPVFIYDALNHQGQRIRGNLDAADKRQAATILRGRSLFVTDLSVAAATPGPRAGHSLLNHDVSIHFKVVLGVIRPVRTHDRVLFLQQLALMLRAGLTLLQALGVCREQTLKPRLAAAIDRMINAIQEGKSLSQAIAAEKRIFSKLTIRMVECAEVSGELDETLERTAKHLEQQAELITQLITSLIYPVVVVLTAISVATFLVVNVIPKFAAFLARRHTALPWSTRVLLDLSSFLTSYGGYVLAALLFAGIAITVTYATPRGRLALDRGLLAIPIVGGLITVGAMSQFSQTLAMLLGSGITLLDSLTIVANVVPNRAIGAQVTQAHEQILRGKDLASSLRHRIIPRLVTQMISVGERTGTLSHVLDEVGNFYSRLLQARIRRLMGLVEPVLILVIGAMVGFVYLAFFQVIFKLAGGGG